MKRSARIARTTEATNSRGRRIWHGRVDDAYGHLTECDHGHRTQDAAHACAQRMIREGVNR